MEEAKKYASEQAASAGTDAKKQAQFYVDALNESLGQKSIFDRLTNNGQVQGIYLKDGKVYINGTYIDTGVLDADLLTAGIIADKAGKNYWDLTTGEFALSGDATVGDGTAGKTVTAVDVQYGNSSSSSTAPTTWTTYANWKQGQYLWTRLKLTLADGTTEYTSARRMADTDGIGVSQVREQYYLSTSSSTQTGGSWQYYQPAWVSGRYYWTRSAITWSDGTVTYTTPVLARALTSGNQSTDDLDASLTQRDVFNRLTNNGKTQGIYLSNGLIYINGEYIRANTISTDRIETTRNSGTYVNVGTTSDNYTGASFFTRNNNYLNIASIHAVDSPSGTINGVGFDTFNKAFLDASTYYRQVVLETPEVDGFMSNSNERLSMRSGSDWYVNLLGGGFGQRGLFFDANDVVIQFDRTHYVRITSDGVQCRCGSNGFGWLNGQFHENLVWS